MTFETKVDNAIGTAMDILQYVILLIIIPLIIIWGGVYVYLYDDNVDTSISSEKENK